LIMPIRNRYPQTLTLIRAREALSLEKSRDTEAEMKARTRGYIFGSIVYLVGRLNILYSLLSERWSNMMRTFITVIVGTIVVLCAGAAGAALTEYRGRLEVLAPVEKDLNLTVLTEVRSKNDLHTHNESHFDLGLDYTPTRWLAVGPGYRHVTEQVKDIWRVEHRPNLDVTFCWNLWGLGFSNRNRLEYRMLETREFLRYRFRIQAKMQPAGFRWLQVQLSDEPFYDFSAGEVNKNRFTAGFDVRVLSTIRLGFNYVVDSTKAGDKWVDLNAPTAVFKYRL